MIVNVEGFTLLISVLKTKAILSLVYSMYILKSVCTLGVRVS